MVVYTSGWIMDRTGFRPDGNDLEAQIGPAACEWLNAADLLHGRPRAAALHAVRQRVAFVPELENRVVNAVR